MPACNGPVLIGGMHRSGTSLLSRLLQQSGVFLGQDLEDNDESMFYIVLNDWLLNCSGGCWWDPRSVQRLLDSDSLKELTEDYLFKRVGGLSSLRYRGVFRSSACVGLLSGWKDPRNTFTFPVWKSMFPHAKIILPVRHGVDVAASLCKRNHKTLASSQKRRKLISKFYSYKGKSGSFVESPFFTIHSNFELWERYMYMISAIKKTYQDDVFTYKYEDLIENPEAVVKGISEFLGLAIPLPLEKLNQARSNSYVSDPELLAYYNKHASFSSYMKEWGY